MPIVTREGLDAAAKRMDEHVENFWFTSNVPGVEGSTARGKN
ncbi:MAG TPA: hypothetical protein VFW94_09130 [Candidatus Acidoferrales bacterium]|nr:hypothetical protein [Candidatus Acidoferrales bacterium]